MVTVYTIYIMLPIKLVWCYKHLKINISHKFAAKAVIFALKIVKKIALKPSQSAANPYLCTPNFGNLCLQ